eukprot:COSAG01_NODE_42329_length_441_cov_0.862573_1_plen_21_part_01
MTGLHATTVSGHHTEFIEGST